MWGVGFQFHVHITGWKRKKKLYTKKSSSYRTDNSALEALKKSPFAQGHNQRLKG